jgi:glucose/arabinose dehydrogenase
MVRRLAALLLCVTVLASCGGGSNKKAEGLVEIGQGLKGPSGTTAEVAAIGLTHAAAFAFDSKQQLWVATADYSDSGEDAVYVVTAAGQAPVKVIAGMHTPLGLLWLYDMLYVASKEVVEAYTGFDGTAFAAHHTVVQFPAGVGEVNGLVLAPDGRIQLGISAPCDHCETTIEFSAAIVSFWPDGSDLRVDADHIRAPIALAYYPNTDDLFVTMNQRDDLGDDATPGDWLAIVERGQSWGFPDCYGQGGSPCIGVPNPVAELDKHAALSGLAITGNLAVAAEWAKGIVQGVKLSPSNGSYTGTTKPLLTGFKNPVAVAVGADGALFVGDWTTGIIYRIKGI